jgi:hypothetical protein
LVGRKELAAAAAAAAAGVNVKPGGNVRVSKELL